MEFIDTTGVAKPEDHTGNKVTSVHLVASVLALPQNPEVGHDF